MKNPVAKHSRAFNKGGAHKDRKKELKINPVDDEVVFCFKCGQLATHFIDSRYGCFDCKIYWEEA